MLKNQKTENILKVKKKLREKKDFPYLDPDQIDLFVDWYNKHHGNITLFRAQNVGYKKKKLREFVKSLTDKQRQYKLNF